MIELVVPIVTVSLTNQREHYRVRADRARSQREAVRMVWCQAKKPKIRLPSVIHLVRIAGRNLDDDNLRGAMKHVRDELALIAGVDDRDRRILFTYDQDAGEAAVRIELMSIEEWRRAEMARLDAWAALHGHAIKKRGASDESPAPPELNCTQPCTTTES